MPIHRLFVGAAVFVLSLLGASTSPAQPVGPLYFRSDFGLAPASTGTLPGDLEASGAFRWRMPVDEGHSTPIVYGGNIFLTGYNPSSEELSVFAVEAETGRTRWRNGIHVDRVEQTHPIGSPATATVACDGERIYAFFGSYGLVCYDLSGKRIWERRMGPFQDEYGAGSSPILLDGKLILNQDHDIGSFLLAVDAATGKEIWKVERPDAVRSYATPAVWRHEGKSELLVAGALELSSYNPLNGQRLWWVDGLARIVIPTPLPVGDKIYMASWAPGGDPGRRINLDSWESALAKWDVNHDGKLSRSEVKDGEVLDRFFRMDRNQDGMLDQQEWERHANVFRKAQNSLLALQPTANDELPASNLLWKYGRGVPYVATPVLADGSLYMVKEGGIVTKIEAATGKMLQEERVLGVGHYFASPVAGDGKVYFSSEPGVVSVLAQQSDWRVLSSHEFHERIYATPAFGRGCIYIRTEKALYCFQAPK